MQAISFSLEFCATTFLVGCSFRDALLNLPVPDKAWVVPGSTPPALLEQGYHPGSYPPPPLPQLSSP
ncbi:MAG TPA: hypothetical protein DCS68_10825, partial [Pantoea agglomerans]|nr:hypothetical protein [Pantoea agglomerans]